ncbi:hypothetical protein CK203_081792 [Vitis vinifera]|uniref:Uncharacterized protein n=1 Tax=Vitis vinifera TaxID=29760 RepID=A0A438EA82_VITVI|nr:hypothetical protein CK203_081792 [Vitis vinifera]
MRFQIFSLFLLQSASIVSLSVQFQNNSANAPSFSDPSTDYLSSATNQKLN